MLNRLIYNIYLHYISTNAGGHKRTTTMKTQITLIEATEKANGLFAHNDTFNPNMVNIVKKSLSGRSNGLVMRFNTITNELIMDGTTHRRYVNFCDANGNEIDLYQFIPQLETLKIN